MDRIHKRVQVFLHSCDTTFIKNVESGNLAEFGGMQQKVERGEWLTLTPRWVDQPAPKEEVRRKSDEHGSGSRSSGRGGGRDAVSNTRVDPQLRIMERLGEMTASERSENLHRPLVADGRKICL